MSSADPVFAGRETHGRVFRPGNRLIAHSQDAGWRSMHAAIIEEAPFSASESACRHPSVIYHLSRPTEVTRRIEGTRGEKALIGPRRLCLTPGDATTLWQHGGHPEILQVYLRRSIYDAAVSEIYGCDASTAELVPRFAITDPLLEQLAMAIVNALRDGTSEDALYIDAISHMMAAHLAREHSTRSRPVRVLPVKPIAGGKMRRLVEFIEENLENDLSLNTLAAEVEISPLYLARAFRAAVGQSPHQYILARRIERARDLLRNTDLPVVDVALAVGFSSQSHLAHWFLRQVGVSPAAYRKQV
ncbi:MAG TPA: AraC family transcriptional regulator [Bryobacteraceae bacterium]|jgi:AraC family transcriptional regulator|nr:AraC family transcriptional regulator [Bryobacteraceae bacterium]